MSAPAVKPGIAAIVPYAGGKSAGKPGQKMVKLSSNETPLGASPAATQAYIEAAGALHRYPDGTAKLLREAIGGVHGLTPDRLLCGAGSDELIGLLAYAYTGPGDEVLYPEYGFLMYRIYALAAGATPTTARERERRTDVDALLAAVTPRTRLVFLANPNNPTGSYIGRNELKRLRDGLPEHVILAIDGAYAEYAADIADYHDGRELVEAGENTVMLRTFSKIYGLPALRLGWAYAPVGIIDTLNRIRGPFNVSAPAIAAGAAAVRDEAFVRRAREFNARERAWLAEALAALGLTVWPSIANFLLVEFPASGAHTAANANAFLMERGYIPREVGNYGLPHCLRITIGLEEDNRAVARILEEFLRTVPA